MCWKQYVPINRAELDKYTEGGRVFGFIINPLINIEEIVQYSEFVVFTPIKPHI